jgi:phosphomannomutase
MAESFGTDGIRGKVSEYQVTDQIAERLGVAIVNEWIEKFKKTITQELE